MSKTLLVHCASVLLNIGEIHFFNINKMYHKNVARIRYYSRLTQSIAHMCFRGHLKHEMDLGAELSRLLTNCNLLLIPNYMTKIVVSDVIHYITHFGNQT